MSDIDVKKLSEDEKTSLGVEQWGTWSCEVSRFNWHYDTKETCYLIEGEVEIETEEGVTKIQAGDFVTFPKGLTCVWDVKKPVRKFFRFD